MFGRDHRLDHQTVSTMGVTAETDRLSNIQQHGASRCRRAIAKHSNQTSFRRPGTLVRDRHITLTHRITAAKQSIRR